MYYMFNWTNFFVKSKFVQLVDSSRISNVIFNEGFLKVAILEMLKSSFLKLMFSNLLQFLVYIYHDIKISSLSSLWLVMDLKSEYKLPHKSIWDFVQAMDYFKVQERYF